MATTVVPKICPSLLSADFARLADESKRMVDCGADYLHVDVMDGHFVPNLTLGAPVVKSLRKHTKAYLDCHLMVTNPGQWISDYAAAGADGVTFHIETVKSDQEFDELVAQIKDKGMRAGVAISPDTPLDALMHQLERVEKSAGGWRVDMALVMTVRPGFGGQSFMAEQLEKVRALRQRFPHLDIQVDGGLTCSTVQHAAKAGANVIVSGSGIFGTADPAKAIQEMRGTVQAAILASNSSRSATSESQ